MDSVCHKTVLKSKPINIYDIHNTGGESDMSLLSKYTVCCPDDINFWLKIASFWPTQAQIISACEFGILHKHFKVIIDL